MKEKREGLPSKKFSHIFLETHERDPIGHIRYLLDTHTHTKRERESLCAGNYRGLRKRLARYMIAEQGWKAWHLLYY